ncbi:copper resistance protein CopC [Gammaproteobacteria bacterium]|nr:copper resistance protein CopC [Gammaproteobacteria bacterium]
MLARILTKNLPLLGLAFLLISQANAHSGLATTIPDHEAILENAPTQLRFLFKAEVTITNIRIDHIDPEKPDNDNIIDRIEPTLPRNRVGQSTAFGRRVDLDIPELTPANYPAHYRVVWQAMSPDGHYIVDDFTFTVTAD